MVHIRWLWYLTYFIIIREWLKNIGRDIIIRWDRIELVSQKTIWGTILIECIIFSSTIQFVVTLKEFVNFVNQKG